MSHELPRRIVSCARLVSCISLALACVGCHALLPFSRSQQRDGSDRSASDASPGPSDAPLAGDATAYDRRPENRTSEAGAPDRRADLARRDASTGPDGAAPVGWAKRWGASLIDTADTIALDSTGTNIYLAAYVQDAIDLGGGTLPFAGSFDVALASYQGNGAYRWSVSFGCSLDDYPRALAVDATGNVYLAGFFAGSMTVKGTSGSSAPLTSAGSYDIFVSSFTSAGAHRWSRSFGSTQDDRAYGVAVGTNGQVFLTGQIGTPVDFGKGAVGGPKTNVFLVALAQATGATLWSKGFSSPGDDFAYWAATDSSGNVHLTGHISGPVDFGGGPLPQPAGMDAFVASFGADGSHRWSKSLSSPSNDNGEGLTTDAASNLYVVGYVGGTVDFGAGPVKNVSGQDLFVASYTSNGAYRFGKIFGSSLDDVARSVAVSTTGQVYITGSGGAINFGNGPLPATSSDIFVASFSSAGAHLWSKSYGGPQTDFGHGIAVRNGNVVVTGNFYNTVNFGFGPLTATGSVDIFLLSLPP